jgi:hypothetical protein
LNIEEGSFGGGRLPARMTDKEKSRRKMMDITERVILVDITVD